MRHFTPILMVLATLVAVGLATQSAQAKGPRAAKAHAERGVSHAAKAHGAAIHVAQARAHRQAEFIQEIARRHHGGGHGHAYRGGHGPRHHGGFYRGPGITVMQPRGYYGHPAVVVPYLGYRPVPHPPVCHGYGRPVQGFQYHGNRFSIGISF